MASNNHRNALKPGYMVHWYRIEKILGQGGFGITYLAEDTNLNQRVAVKEYLPIEVAVREGDFSVHPVSENHSESFTWGLERFVDEARTLARFDHPNIVRVMSVFEMNNTAYMVMRYEQGRSLQQMLAKRATLEEERLIGMLFPILEGLERVHAAGFVHRDVKPGNIYIREDGSPVLLDFGSARQSLGEATRTLTTLVSPGYAPFEQYFSKSDRQGPWTDVYGLGATFYRAVTGVAPMNAVDRSEGIIKHHRDPLTPAAEAGAGRYSPHLLAAIDWAIRFHEDSRPQNIGEWRQALQGQTAPPRADTGAAEAPTAVAGDVEAGTESVDLLLLPTAPTAPLKTHAPAREAPKKRRRVLVAALAAVVLLFIGLNANEEPGNPAPAAETPPPASASADELQAPATGDKTSPQVEVLAAAPPAPARSFDPPASESSAAQAPQSGDEASLAVAAIPAAAAPTRKDLIADLLNDARADIEQLRLSTPPGNNALEKYRQVLALDGQNQEAKNGVRKIVETYAELGKQAAQRKDFERASFFIDQALAIAPNSRPLKRAQRKLNRIRRRNR